MSNLSAFEQLDANIDALLAGQILRDSATEDDELLAIANELRAMPDPDFKARLKADLNEAATSTVTRSEVADVLPTLFGRGYAEAYPIHRSSFAVSMALHAAAVLLLAFSGAWLMQNREASSTKIISLITTDASPYDLPVAPDLSHGGGGGGDHDKLPASKGEPPRFAREQITPPATVIRNDNPRLAVEPTVVGPPTIKFPASVMGDPLSNVTVASNGTGSSVGIGSGSGGGVGVGSGAGVGPGYGGGIGGGVYRVGGGVSAPRALYTPDPDYSEEARKARYQGVVVLWLIVGSDGRPRDLKVARSLGMGLDQKAIEAVKNWRFAPAIRDGHAVAVQINVEVSFRLY
jgi:TonB family protein